MSVLSESVQVYEGQATQHVILKKLYTVLSKGLTNRVTNFTIKLQRDKEVCII